MHCSVQNSFYLRNLVLIFFMAVLVSVVKAQSTPETIRQIDEVYNLVQLNIERQAYLQNEFKINAERFSLHQPGYFQHFELYHYAIDRRPGAAQKPLLKAVFIRTDKEDTQHLKEYIFDNDGNCVVYGEKEITANLTQGEARIYLHEGKIIRWLQENVVQAQGTTEAQHKLQEIQALVQKYQDRFQKQISVVQFP
ncbi:MAG: hypothetical protein HC880_09545 [Bacteroidia bacterium]|nr:hypothetical protein [Bacteroidia bacterium]